MDAGSKIRLIGLICGLVAPVGCKTTAPPTPPETSELQRLEAGRLTVDAGEKLDGVGVSTVERGAILERLEQLQSEPEFKARAERFGIQAVAAFELGEGGAVVKYARGSGRVKFIGGREDADLGLEAYSFGAVIGGSASQGVIVFVGLHSEGAIDGTYVGQVVRAAAATQETGDATVLVHEVRGHYAYVVAQGQGLSADAGKAKLTLSVR